MKHTAYHAIQNEQDKLANYLNKQGLKLSSGRLKVFKIIVDTHGHFAAEEIVKICRQRNIAVSRATIYRTLRELLEAGVIRETAFGEKHQHFEHVYDEKLHHHAHCIRCHNNIEFPDLQEDNIYRPLLEKKGFQILGHEMHFYGICHKCLPGQ